MAKKRKAEASSRLDEADRNLYANFRGAANALSQLYSQQRLSFLSGERHSLEIFYQRLSRQREEGTRVTTEDILAYLQEEIEYGTDDTIPILPSPLSNQLLSPIPSAHFDAPSSYNVSTPPTNFDHQQVKNSIFSNALSSPVRRSLQQYHFSSQHNHVQSSPARNEPQNPNQRHSHTDPHISEDFTDMHTDDLDPSCKTY